MENLKLGSHIAIYNQENRSTIFILWIHIYLLYLFKQFLFLEDNCFTMLWWSLPYINASNNYIYIYISVPSWASHSHPILPIEVATEHQAGPPVLCISFPLVIYLTQDSVYTSVLLSQFVLPFLPLLWRPVCSLYLHLHFFSINRFISTIFLDSIYMH